MKTEKRNKSAEKFKKKSHTFYFQGFICPFCMEDFGEYERLIGHVEDDHPEEDSSDLAGLFVSNVKGFFDKAKRGIQKLDAKKSIAEIASVSY